MSISDKKKEYMKMYREKNKDKIREQQRLYKEKHKDLCKEIDRRWRENNRDKKRERDKIYYKKNKEKIYAKKMSGDKTRSKVDYKLAKFIKRHGIERPSVCPICGLGGKICAHHPDYDKWNEIVWCCSKCHLRIHHGWFECPKPINILTIKKLELRGKLQKYRYDIVVK